MLKKSKMYILSICLLLALLPFAISGCGGQKTALGMEGVDNDCIEEADSFLSLIYAGDFAAASQAVASDRVKSYSKEALAENKEEVENQLGTWSGYEISAGYPQENGSSQIIFTCFFTDSTLLANITLDQEGKIIDFFFSPDNGNAMQKDDGTPLPEFLQEYILPIGEEDNQLPGILTVPKNCGAMPVVILVHGSDGGDRDQTIGHNKPFRDLAWGLAQRGIAVLRYDKRSYVYPEASYNVKDYTVEDEVINDVQSAVQALQEQKHLDINGIYILGHDIGGMLIPRIAEANPDVNGFMVLSGQARHLTAALLDKTEYLFKVNPNQIAAEELDRQMTALSVAVEKINNLKEGDVIPSNQLLGMPVSYWLDLKDYQPAREAKKIDKPLLFLQGEKDFQVNMKDFNIWKQELEYKDNATFISYPQLNHLFMPVTEGESSPAEYKKQGHVLDQVLFDIARWVKCNNQ